MALAIALMSGAGVAQAAFSAHGSVEQVYVTHLGPGAQASLLDPGGQSIATKRATAQGGVLFRNVKPGTGYRVRRLDGGATSGPLKVLSRQPAPPSTSIYNQTIPTDGYGYLKTRDGTKLAHQCSPAGGRDQRLPGVDSSADPVRSDADPDRVLGLRVRGSGGSAERDRDPRQPDGVHGGRRQHARHRLLRRRLRLLRAAAEPRRVRRDRDGRPPALGPCTTRSG